MYMIFKNRVSWITVVHLQLEQSHLLPGFFTSHTQTRRDGFDPQFRDDFPMKRQESCRIQWTTSESTDSFTYMLYNVHIYIYIL